MAFGSASARHPCWELAAEGLRMPANFDCYPYGRLSYAGFDRVATSSVA